jgi:hypothetical protein
MMDITGMQVSVVDAGAVVGKGPDGQEFVVTDTSAVFNGPKMWVTQKLYDEINAAIDAAALTPTKEPKP